MSERGNVLSPIIVSPDKLQVTCLTFIDKHNCILNSLCTMVTIIAPHINADAWKFIKFK